MRTDPSHPGRQLLTWQAVLTTASALLHRRGTTTTLDVKRALRAEGYWAIQADVSYLMANLAAVEGWLWWDNGRFRTYAAGPVHDLALN